MIVTDNWIENSSGVMVSLMQIKNQLEAGGFSVSVIHPSEFRNFPLPTYASVRLSLVTSKKLEDILRIAGPDYIHIATEGPLGLAARNACVKNNWNFTTQYHTRLPEYLQIRLKSKTLKDLGINVGNRYMHWFHGASRHVMVSTESLRKELEAKKFKNLVISPLGVDTDSFKKNLDAEVPYGLKKPIFIFLGRIAPEKNVEAFLDCNLPGSKLVIGDGPSREMLEEKYKNSAVFVGHKKDKELVDLLSIGDFFVFPSKTDTFGLAVIEALACELPVAAYDVVGLRDVITNGVDGYLGDNLEESALKCLEIDRQNCRKKAMMFSWENAGRIFIENLVPL